jgi:hypothetical protein
MNKFEVGNKYGVKRKVLYGTRESYLILSRTEKTITYECGTGIKAKIFIDELGNECFMLKGFPFSEVITS